MKIGFGRRYKSLGPDYLGYTDIWKLVSTTAPVGTMPGGAGTLDDPYKPLGIADWFWLSRKKVDQNAFFVRVGDRLIAKWGGSAGFLKSYTSDVTDLPRSDLAQEKAASTLVKERGEAADKQRGFDIEKEMVYTRKARRVENVYSNAASYARELLWGHSSGDPDASELANTICGLLISEGGADRDNQTSGAVFLSTFMLLDLIEKSIPYGMHGQRYTWASMLMHAGKDKPAPVDIPGRQSKKGDDAAKRLVAKHPMAGFNTVNLAKTINQNVANASRDRIVSIATAWLVNNLAEGDHSSDWKYVYVKVASGTTVTPKKNPMGKSYQHLIDVASTALRTRAGTTSCLLNGSRRTAIDYETV